MVNKAGKKYTVGDVYKAAGEMLKNEMADLKSGQSLSKVEEAKMEKLAKLLSNTVLKEMKVV